MSNERALAIMAGRNPDAEIGGIIDIKMPGAIKTEMDDLVRATNSFTEEVTRQFYAPLRDKVQAKLSEAQLSLGRPLTPEEVEKVRASFGLAPSDPTTLHPQFVTAYVTWQNGVHQWFEAHKGWMSRAWYSTYEKSQVLKGELIEWRKKFRELGGTTESPDPHVEKPLDFLGVAKMMLIVGGVAIGGGLLWKLVK